MVSKRIALLVGIVVFVVASLAFAGVALADSYTDGTYTSGLHSNVVKSSHNVETESGNVCEACHVPHFAESTAFLWANPPVNQTGVQGGYTSIIRGLCYSCHDGSGMPGQYTVFDTTKWSHPTRDVVERGSPGRDCDLCHDPHEQNLPDATHTTGPRPNFIRYDRIGSSTNIVYLGPNVCVSCHTGNIEGGGSSHSPGGGVAEHNHPIDFTGTVTNSGGSTQVDYVVTKGGADPPVAAEPPQYVQNDTVQQWGVRFFDPAYTKVPVATLSSSGTMNCESCHAPHGAENETLNTDTLTDGVLCTDCHN